MSVDWTGAVRSVVDLGSESWERRTTRLIVKAGAVALFVLFVWKLSQRG